MSLSDELSEKQKQFIDVSRRCKKEFNSSSPHTDITVEGGMQQNFPILGFKGSISKETAPNVINFINKFFGLE